MLDVSNRTPGEILTEIPVGDLVTDLSESIADAQLRLDQVGIEIGLLLAESEVEFTDADGQPVKRTLLQLGFRPNFYHFTKATITVHMSISFKVERSTGFGFAASIGNLDLGGLSPPSTLVSPPGGGDDKVTVPFGAAISIDHHRKFEYDISGATTVTAELLSVPGPQPFLDLLDSLNPE